MGNWRFVAKGLRQQNHDAQRLSQMISNSVVTVVSYLQDKMKIRRALFLSIQSSFFEDFMKAGILIYKDYVCENKKGILQKRNEPLESVPTARNTRDAMIEKKLFLGSVWLVEHRYDVVAIARLAVLVASGARLEVQH